MDQRGAIDLSEAPHAGDGLVDMHLQHLRARSLSPETIKARRNTLNRLARFLEAPPVGATRHQLADYIEARRAGRLGRGKPLSDDSIRNEIAHLAAFYDWLQRFDYRLDDPTARLILPKKDQPDVGPIPDDELARAMSAGDPEDKVILGLSAFAGLRAAEVAALRWEDVDLRAARLVVRRGKGGKRRHLPISSALDMLLKALPHRAGYVVPRRDGGPGANAAYVISRRASVLLGGRATGYTLHQCRHRFASSAYQATQDIRAVQQALGHVSPATTAIYADPGRDAVRIAVEAAGRLAQDGEVAS